MRVLVEMAEKELICPNKSCREEMVFNREDKTFECVNGHVFTLLFNSSDTALLKRKDEKVD